MAKSHANVSKKVKPTPPATAKIVESAEPAGDDVNGDGRRKLAQYEVTPEEFCRVWTAASSADEVAEKLDMPKPIVSARASTYREKGIPLKKMPRGSSKRGLDVQGLKELVEALNKQHNVPASLLDGGDEAPARAPAAADSDPIDVDLVAAAVAKVLADMKKPKR